MSTESFNLPLHLDHRFMTDSFLGDVLTGGLERSRLLTVPVQNASLFWSFPYVRPEPVLVSYHC